WDDPRMPTISGMRRRGYTPAGLRLFAKRVGVSKSENVVDMDVLEGAIREDLEHTAPRMMAVLRPLKVEITNFDESKIQGKTASYHPEKPEFGERELKLAPTIYIEADDFAIEPPKGWKRLVAGGEVRLRHSYVMKCEEVVQDSNGNITALKCSIDYDTLGKNPEDRKVKGVIHWLPENTAVKAQVRLYDRLFTEPRPDAVRGEDGEYRDFIEFLNPESQTVITALVEPIAQTLKPESHWQFERLGYFVTDRFDHKENAIVFNRTVTLRDTWKKK
ncbi:MAG: glutamine--tRNA ligase, partial [Neisseriaceae bacterium]|nr:glutamine--tRNA ligase [Neisseriaceae bacterium]